MASESTSWNIYVKYLGCDMVVAVLRRGYTVLCSTGRSLTPKTFSTYIIREIIQVVTRPKFQWTCLWDRAISPTQTPNTSPPAPERRTFSSLVASLVPYSTAGSGKGPSSRKRRGARVFWWGCTLGGMWARRSSLAESGIHDSQNE